MTDAITIPAELRSTAERTWGAAGHAWAEALPDLVEASCARWDLRPVSSDFTFSYSFVLAVERRDGQEAVLKLRPANEELRCEMRALEVYSGDAMCTLLEHDDAAGAMLLERVRPGVPLLEMGETDEAVIVAAALMRRLRRLAPEDPPLPRLLDWWRTARDGLRGRHGGTTGPMPEAFVDEATEIYEELFGSGRTLVVLHGDLHHWNILSSDRAGWLAIDPHGATGPPECEVGAFMMNPNNGALARPDVREVLGRRLDLFSAELGFEREYLRRAAFAYSMLSTTWSTEDGGDRWTPGLEIARVLRAL